MFNKKYQHVNLKKEMKKIIQLIAMLIIVATFLIASPCRKDDLFTTLANEAHPDLTAKADDADTSGYWVAKTRICFITEP